MSKQFTVHKLFQLLEPAKVDTGYISPGSTYTNLEMKGRLFAVDEQGDLFVLNQEELTFGGGNVDDWRSKAKKPKRLYRDYWSHVSPAFDAPYTKSIVAGQHDIVWELPTAN